MPQDPLQAGTVPIAGRVSLRGNSGRWSLDHQLRAGSAVDLSGRYGGDLHDPFAKSTLDGTLSLTTTDLQALARDVSRAALASGFDATGRLDGAATGTVRVSGRLGGPVFVR